MFWKTCLLILQSSSSRKDITIFFGLKQISLLQCEVFAIFSVTFNLSVWNAGDYLSSIFLASFISSAILVFHARVPSSLEDLLLLLDLDECCLIFQNHQKHGSFLKRDFPVSSTLHLLSNNGSSIWQPTCCDQLHQTIPLPFLDLQKVPRSYIPSENLT